MYLFIYFYNIQERQFFFLAYITVYLAVEGAMFILRFYVRASRFENFVQKPSMFGV